VLGAVMKEKQTLLIKKGCYFNRTLRKIQMMYSTCDFSISWKKKLLTLSLGEGL